MNQQFPALGEDVVLRDGSTVHVRPVRSEDEAALLSFFDSLSAHSRRLRFFSAGVAVAPMAHLASTVDGVSSFGLIAEAGPDGRVTGHASYQATEPDRAEVAFTVADEAQGRGLGTILLGQLAQAAASNGIRVFEAQMLPTNNQMLEVFRQSGFPIEVEAGVGELRIEFPTSLTEMALERFERRDQIASANALRAFLHPRSVAVIGASRHRGTVGGEVLHNLISAPFTGPVYPVNPTATAIEGAACYPSVEAIPGPVDLAVVAVAASRVLEVVEQCARKGVRALLVLSAGFAEVGEDGRALQNELVRRCRSRGMRLIGPNCLGITNTDPDVQLNATFGPTAAAPGRVGFLSQSGGLGLAAIHLAGSFGVGISSFVSVGNRADISGNDLLSYWEADPQTDVILLYLESFGNPQKFARIARRVGRRKPILALKGGRSPAGARATGSHTGALLAASDVTVDALFRQAGVVRADTMEELLGTASLFISQPLPGGRGVAIVTNAGGPGILCADACEAHGLSVPMLAEKTQARLRQLLPPAASVANPVDMIASATAEQFRAVISAVADDPSVHAVIVIFLQPLGTRAAEVAEAVVAAAEELRGSLPVLSVFMGGSTPPELRRGNVRVPWYAFPEPAAIALANAARYAEWRRRPAGRFPSFPDIRRDEATSLIARALGRGPGWLNAGEVTELLSCYGIPTVEQRSVATPEEAAQAARDLGGRVALKGAAPGVLHKTEAGLVRLGLTNPSQVRREAKRMADQTRSLGHTVTGFLVQRMVSGVEMIAGVVRDPLFGSLVACGAGGVLVELLKDVSVRLSPVSEQDVEEMVRALRTYPMLTGYRGGPKYDVPALEETLLRISSMADGLPQIAEMDCNPLIVCEQGVAVVDARIRVEPPNPVLPLGTPS